MLSQPIPLAQQAKTTDYFQFASPQTKITDFFKASPRGRPQEVLTRPATGGSEDTDSKVSDTACKLLRGGPSLGA